MATIKSLKRRIKAAKNITQITKAMEMVAASKMRRSQQKALASRPYANKLNEVLKRMSSLIDSDQHQLLLNTQPDEKNHTLAILVISTDKGLCGGLNSNLFRSLEVLEKSLGEKYAKTPIKVEYITIGKKAREYILKSGRNLHAEFSNLPDRPQFSNILPITKVLMDGFTSNRYFAIHLLYSDFVSTIAQKPQSQKLLPIDTQDIQDIQPTPSEDSSSEPKFQYLFEPDSHTILQWLLPYYFELLIYQKILEAQASEHSARMVAMRNASENANDIIKFLNLEYNRKRQSIVTSEIADIVISRMAVT